MSQRIHTHACSNFVLTRFCSNFVLIKLYRYTWYFCAVGWCLYCTSPAIDNRINVLQTDWQPRNSNVDFSCGQQVRHLKYNYRGVIVGWDSVCIQSREWMKIMNVESLTHGTGQPFYHVLVDVRDRTDGQTTYAAQENLTEIFCTENKGNFLCEVTCCFQFVWKTVLGFSTANKNLQPIMHPEIEKYFTSFVPSEGRYILDDELRDKFPED